MITDTKTKIISLTCQQICLSFAKNLIILNIFKFIRNLIFKKNYIHI